VKNITNQPILFNGLKIVYSFDRTTRVPLKNTKADENLPMIFLYIGKPRDLSITPLRFNPAVEATEVCDVSLAKYSLVTIPASQLNTYTHISLLNP
jgi:hypothetical protein